MNHWPIAFSLIFCIFFKEAVQYLCPTFTLMDRSGDRRKGKGIINRTISPIGVDAKIIVIFPDVNRPLKSSNIVMITYKTKSVCF